MGNRAENTSVPSFQRWNFSLEEPAGTIELLVEDTGPGIAPELHDEIFEPFVRAASAPGGWQGAGLGLAIARRLARLMGGDVTLDSRVGTGTTFRARVVLPIAEGATAAGPEDLLAPTSRAMGAEVVPVETGEPRRVLICEDDVTNLRALRRMLVRVGFEVTTAENGERGWQLLREADFDVVITDVEMPRVDGLELVRRVRAREAEGSCGRVPIVVATAHVGEADNRRIREAGADAHLPKPFTLAMLRDVLAQLPRAAERRDVR